MSDNLRDRIAAVDEKHCQVLMINAGGWACACGVTFPSGVAYREWRLHRADAVIAELGLRRESRPNDYDHVQYPPGDRYITDWLADD